jgi:hypothetical protein
VALFLLVVHLEDWARGLALLVEFKTSQVSFNNVSSMSKVCELRSENFHANNEKNLEKNDGES